MDEREYVSQKGVSIIVVTDSIDYLRNIFENYQRQDVENKELIIICNRELHNFDLWIDEATNYTMVRIYQQDEGTSLGQCLSYGIERAIFEYIAIFGEKHYYGPQYLSETIRIFENIDADLIGKNAYDLHILNSEITYSVNGKEYDYVNYVPLATFIFKTELYDRIKFINEDAGIDVQFCNEYLTNEKKIYSTGRQNYLLKI